MSPSTALPRLAVGVILLLSAVVMFTRLGAEPITRTSEARCYDVARHMIQTGDLLVPIHDDRIRLQKPPLYYWMAVASARLAGGLTNDSLRLPSALAAMLLLVVVAMWGHALGGMRLSLASVAALAVTLQFYRLGRQGTAEVTLALASTIALMVYEIGVRRRGMAPRPGVALATGVAFLTKATTALITIPLPIVVDLAVRRRLRTVVRRPVVLWSLVALAIGGAWYVYVLFAVPGAFDALWGDVARPFGVDAGERADAGHYRPPWYYLDKIFGAAFPASLLIPVVVWAAVRTRFHRSNPGMRFVLLAFVTVFIAFSILPQKQKHYLIQVLPLLAILIGDATLLWWDEERTSLIGWLRPVGLALSVVALVIVGFLGAFFHLLPRAGAWVYVPLAAAGVALVIAGVAAARARPTVFLLAFVLAWYGIAWGYFAEIRPWREQVNYADDHDLPLPDETRLLRIAQEHPRVTVLLGVEKEVRRRLDTAPPASEGPNRDDDP